MLFDPPGSAVVTSAAVPVAADGRFSRTDPKTVVTPPLMVEKLTVPTPVVGATVAVRVTLVPTLIVPLAEDASTTELVVRAEEAAHAVNRAFMSTEPSPVTVL